MRLADLAARREFAHVGLDVEHRRAVDGVESGNFERQIFDRDQAADRDADPIRPILAALGEDTDFGPVDAIARMTRIGGDLGLVYQMKEEDDLDMRELSQTREAIGSESSSIQIDPATDAAPDVVNGLLHGAMNDSDGAELKRMHVSPSYSARAGDWKTAQLVLGRRFFQMIDHDGFERRLAGLELQSHLLHG